MLPVELQDKSHPKRRVVITANGALCIAQIAPDVPAVGTKNRLRYYSSLVGSTGADSGTTNMNVDGSTPQEFYIAAHLDYDIRIMIIAAIIADTAIVHSKFGNIAALANGWDLKVTESGVDTFLINKAKTGGEAIAQAGFAHAFGDGATSFELTNWTGTEDAQSIVIPIHHVIPGGLRIGRGTKDRIVSIVNDNLTGLTEFTLRILGYRHYP